ncbi:exopolysaccharide biosynthesis polyprenyl glycosylphosphotransferase [Succinimonas sp.]|uniref:exopolysaccharide biosynthesis polyprenyl glycosylphosphotransferase n=1 Tax=Succinimonas sp. TaxID=1936151 RepID=UPI003869CD0C
MYHKKPIGWIKNFDFIVLNVFSLHLALMISYYIHVDHSLVYTNTRYLNISIIITLGSILSAIVFQIYKGYAKENSGRKIVANIKQVVIVDTMTIFYFFGTKQGVDYSRIIFAIYFPLFYFLFNYFIMMFYIKLFIKYTKKSSRASLLIITTLNYYSVLKQEYMSGMLGNYKVIGFLILDNKIEKDKDASFECDDEIDYEKITPDNYLEFANRCWIDEVLVVSNVISENLSKILEELTYNGSTVHFALTNTFYQSNLKQITNKIGSYMTITTTLNYMSYEQLICKRLLDIAGAIAGCTITLFLFFILAPIIYLSSPGPIFFTQKRIGMHGRIFNLYKFRTMYLNAEEQKEKLRSQNIVKDDMMFKMEFDPRVIGNKILPDGKKKYGVGSLIRKYSLDEFPQFFNVLKGDMSIVGTRPPTIDEWEKYGLYHKSRLFIKPGITGLWQVSGRSSITNFEDVVALDRKYIREWSILKDVKIILKTVNVVISHKNSF